MLDLLGDVEHDLGDAETAAAHLARALRIGEAAHGPEDEALTSTLVHLGNVRAQGRKTGPS